MGACAPAVGGAILFAPDVDAVAFVAGPGRLRVVAARPGADLSAFERVPGPAQQGGTEPAAGIRSPAHRNGIEIGVVPTAR
jgi:hypothetical protein